jgi:hypothetical protein
MSISIITKSFRQKPDISKLQNERKSAKHQVSSRTYKTLKITRTQGQTRCKNSVQIFDDDERRFGNILGLPRVVDKEKQNRERLTRNVVRD